MRQVTRYEANDGELFETPQQAIQHELEMFLMDEAGIINMTGSEAVGTLLGQTGRIFQIVSQLGEHDPGVKASVRGFDVSASKRKVEVVPPKPVDPEIPDDLAGRLALATQDARLGTGFGELSWYTGVKYLISKGLNDTQIKALMRSETPMWAETQAIEKNVPMDVAIETYLESYPHLLDQAALEIFVQNFGDEA